eukprot:jgi/Mesvir1/22164/Mv18766-RA.1
MSLQWHQADVRLQTLGLESDTAHWRFRNIDGALRVDRLINNQWYEHVNYFGDMVDDTVAPSGGTLTFYEDIQIDGTLTLASDGVSSHAHLRLPSHSDNPTGNDIDYNAADGSSLVPKNYVDVYGKHWVVTPTLDDMTDVTISGAPADGQVLSYSGGAWVPVTYPPILYASTPFCLTLTQSDVNGGVWKEAYVGGVPEVTTYAPRNTFPPTSDLDVTKITVTAYDIPITAAATNESITISVEIGDLAVEPVEYASEVVRVIETSGLTVSNARWNATSSTWSLSTSITGFTKVQLKSGKGYRIRAKVTTAAVTEAGTMSLSVVLEGSDSSFSADVAAPSSTPAPSYALVDTTATVTHNFVDASSNNLVVVANAYDRAKNTATSQNVWDNTLDATGFVSRKFDSMQGNAGALTGQVQFANLDENSVFYIYLVAADAASNKSAMSTFVVDTLGTNLEGLVTHNDNLIAFWNFDESGPYDVVNGTAMHMDTTLYGEMKTGDKVVSYSASSAGDGFGALLYRSQPVGTRPYPPNVIFPSDSAGASQEWTLSMDVYVPSPAAGSYTKIALFRYGSRATTDYVGMGVDGSADKIFLRVGSAVTDASTFAATSYFRYDAWNRVALKRYLSSGSKYHEWFVNGVQLPTTVPASGSASVEWTCTDNSDFYLMLYAETNDTTYTRAQGLAYKNVAVYNAAIPTSLLVKQRTNVDFLSRQAERPRIYPGTARTGGQELVSYFAPNATTASPVTYTLAGTGWPDAYTTLIGKNSIGATTVNNVFFRQTADNYTSAFRELWEVDVGNNLGAAVVGYMDNSKTAASGDIAKYTNSKVALSQWLGDWQFTNLTNSGSGTSGSYTVSGTVSGGVLSIGATSGIGTNTNYVLATDLCTNWKGSASDDGFGSFVVQVRMRTSATGSTSPFNILTIGQDVSGPGNGERISILCTGSSLMLATECNKTRLTQATDNKISTLVSGLPSSPIDGNYHTYKLQRFHSSLISDVSGVNSGILDGSKIFRFWYDGVEQNLSTWTFSGVSASGLFNVKIVAADAYLRLGRTQRVNTDQAIVIDYVQFANGADGEWLFAANSPNNTGLIQTTANNPGATQTGTLCTITGNKVVCTATVSDLHYYTMSLTNAAYSDYTFCVAFTWKAMTSSEGLLFSYGTIVNGPESLSLMVTGGSMMIQLRQDTSTITSYGSPAVTVVAGETYHIAFVRKYNVSTRLYVNGVEYTPNTPSVGLTTPITAKNLYIGGYYKPSTNSEWSNVRFFNHALTLAEVQQLIPADNQAISTLYFANTGSGQSNQAGVYNGSFTNVTGLQLGDPFRDMRKFYVAWTRDIFGYWRTYLSASCKRPRNLGQMTRVTTSCFASGTWTDPNETASGPSAVRALLAIADDDSGTGVNAHNRDMIQAHGHIMGGFAWDATGTSVYSAVGVSASTIANVAFTNSNLTATENGTNASSEVFFVDYLPAACGTSSST